ncbi:MAG: FAD-dependent oxidoreductase [Lentisphaeria bacterium]|nr:FAD-dependent oxidoreductase [Lentisphaeria bacterium]
MKTLYTDVAVIGAGAGGMNAGAVCAGAGMQTLIIDREDLPGGVLNQCIHNGFGLHCFKEELTGPEFASRMEEKARNAGAGFMMSSTVTELVDAGSHKLLTVFCGEKGVVRIQAKAVIFAAGCRERARGNLGIGGSRLAGVFTAGCAQKLLNMDGCLPGRSAVIVGSGDIGLIMARRLSWCGVQVKAVVEIRKHPSGLSRNIAQCLEDFNIPLKLATTITAIRGKNRVESISAAPLDENGKADLSREEIIPCDCVLFSVGLLPETELLKQCGAELDPATGYGAKVGPDYMSTVPGIFSCGNVLHVHDLVDFVAEQAERCANHVIRYLKQGSSESEKEILQVIPGKDLAYTVPQSCRKGEEICFYMRPKIICRKAVLRVFAGDQVLAEKKCMYVKPPEMLSMILPGEKSASAGKETVLRMELCDVEGMEE